MILISLDKSPNPVPPNLFEKISSKDGERLYQVYSELNDLDDEEGED